MGNEEPVVNVETSLGLLNGMAQEFVYNPDGTELSRLDWKFDNIVMFNASAAYQLLPWAKIGLRGSLSMTGSSAMKDYDFNLGFCPPAPGGGTECLSDHSDTQLRQAWMIDAYGEYDLWNEEGAKISVVGGYKWDHYQWQAIGGTANYGALPPGIGISYEQNWSAPYIGLSAEAKIGRSVFTARLVGSNWASADDLDNHHLRSLDFTENFEQTTYLQADVGLRYQLLPTVELTYGYSFQHWGTGKGPTTIYDRVTNTQFAIEGEAAGANSITHMISAGINVQLGGQGQALYDGGASGFDGFYAGVSAGGNLRDAIWTTTSLMSPAVQPDPGSSSADLSAIGPRAGVFAGWNSAPSGLFWGLEGDIGKTNANKWVNGIPGTAPQSTLNAATDVAALAYGWDGSLRVRLGAPFSPALRAYVTGGLAFSQVAATASCPATFPSWCLGEQYEVADKVMTGWTAGAGAEYDFAGNWFTRGEYRYTDLGDFKHDFFASAPLDTLSTTTALQSHRIDLGIGYKF